MLTSCPYLGSTEWWTDYKLEFGRKYLKFIVKFYTRDCEQKLRKTIRKLYIEQECLSPSHISCAMDYVARLVHVSCATELFEMKDRLEIRESVHTIKDDIR